MTLKEMRTRKGMSQMEVAAALPNVTQGAVSQWESGECYPQAQKLQKLAQLYEVTEGEIIAAISEARAAKAHSA